MPGNVALALPMLYEKASSALVAPEPVVQIVQPEGCSGAGELVWAPRASEEDYGWSPLLFAGAEVCRRGGAAGALAWVCCRLAGWLGWCRVG